MDNRVEIISIAASAVGAIVMLYASVFADIHRNFALWINYLGACLILFGPFLYVQDCYWEADEAKAAPPADDLLVPGTGETPQFPFPTEVIETFGIPDSAMYVFLGKSVTWASKFPHLQITQRGEEMVTIDARDSKLSITAKFFDTDGKIICWIDKNRFYPNSEKIFRMDRTPHRLTVFNDEARMVLDVKYINDHAISLLGDFYLRGGTRVLITPDRQEIGLLRILSPQMFGDCKFEVN